MRGMFTCGITDVMMEAGLLPDGVVGVSAGAAFGCNIKSGHAGLWSLLTTGNYYNARFGYHIVPTQLDIFDTEAFAASPMEFHLVCTDVDTGQAVYHQCRHIDSEQLEWIRASSSLPLVARIVTIGGQHLLDGGLADSIPLHYFEQLGYDRNVVILTRPSGYRKQAYGILPLIKMLYHRHPRLVEAVARRHDMYNAQLDLVAEAEAQGRALVFRPDPPLEIGHVCSDPAVLQRTYDQGRRQAIQHLDQLKAFWS